MNKIIIGITILLINGLLLAGCGSESSENGRDFSQMRGGGGSATSVEAVPVQSSTISDQIRSFGTIRAQDVVNITPQVSNRVTEIYADLGDSVSQGDLLAKIYDVPFRDAFEQAQAQFEQSRIAFERDSAQFARQKQLFDSGAISSLEFDEAKATYNTSLSQLESSRAAISNSREDLENTEIRSPVNGVILSRSIAEGDVATTGTTAFEIANLVGYETRLFLTMDDWNAVTLGLPVELQMSNSRQRIARGTISRISPQLDPETGLGEVVVSLVDVTPRVRQGVLAESRITLETRENTIVIPRTAMMENVETYIEPETNTVELRRNYSVFVAQGDSLAIRKQLTLGLEQGERVEVLSGLNEGEKLIVTGQSGLRDSSKVRVAGQEQPLPDRGGDIDVMQQAGDEQSSAQSGTSESNSN
ncbi:MAG: efflux RND transporter periplasmic adaptor subunit [Bacteroidetes bacterium]|nr:efflux RND transporter periplasmic adaptor subunit [Bacteroidota bacterium]